jgi:carbon storage regulator
MLVLSRKVGESIRIGPEVTITIAHVSGNKARLAIDAPDHVIIHRQEVYEAMLRHQSIPPQNPSGQPNLET